MVSTIISHDWTVNRNRVRELSGAVHEILEWVWIATSDFAEIVNNERLKQRTVCQIVRFISHLSLQLHI